MELHDAIGREILRNELGRIGGADGKIGGDLGGMRRRFFGGIGAARLCGGPVVEMLHARAG